MDGSCQAIGDCVPSARPGAPVPVGGRRSCQGRCGLDTLALSAVVRRRRPLLQFCAGVSRLTPRRQ